MNDTMKKEMYKQIKPQGIKEAPQFVECYAHVVAAAPDAPNPVSPYLACRLPGTLSEFAAAALSSTSHFQPLVFSPFQCARVTMEGFSDQKKLTPRSKCIVV